MDSRAWRQMKRRGGRGGPEEVTGVPLPLELGVKRSRILLGLLFGIFVEVIRRKAPQWCIELVKLHTSCTVCQRFEAL